MKKQEKKPTFRNQIFTTLLLLLFLTGCYEFDFVNQPYTADPNSFFNVEISVNLSWGTQDSTEAYFGVLLPFGCTVSDTLEYTSYVTYETGEIIYSDDLSDQMSSIDPPPSNYYWWVGLEDNMFTLSSDTIIIDVKVFTDNQTGTFFLDYMLGDNVIDFYGNVRGLNYRRSNNHLIIIGDPVGCQPEGITLSSQVEIDSFQYNYPDCSEIAGNLYISGDDINNLSGLDIVNAIGGNFSIVANYALSNLTGLNNLTSVGGAFWITSNSSLTDLTGLENINFIGKDLKIESNMLLTSLSSLSGLVTLGNDLRIYGNSQLTNLTGLENITSVAGSLIITFNSNLNNLDGLNNITSTESDLTISGNQYLPDLNGLSIINSVGGTLQITGCDSLYDFSGLDSITAIGRDLIIYSNENLESFSGLEHLDTIGRDIWIGKFFPRPNTPQGNPNLTNILALENLSFIGRDVNINYNNSLTTCEAEGICNYLSFPNGVVNIYGNAPGCNKPTEVAEACGITLPCLPFGPYYFSTQADIDSFQVNYPGCTQLEGNVSIGGNDITNLNGLYGVTSVGGNLSITASNLTNIDGLSLVTYIGGDLRIYGPEIISINPLSIVTSIGGYLWISDTDITDLNCFNGVTSIDGDIRLYDNHYLNNITGLQNIEPASIDNLSIRGNYSLSDCDVESICNYLSAPNGTVTIEYNGTGCNSHMEVVLACESHCFPEGITFSSQAQIDSFQINYPDCSKIEGDVIIDGDDITNLNGLSVITSIGGNLMIGESGPPWNGNPNLINLQGLENITSIGEGLTISGNDILTSLMGLENVTHIDGDIIISSNNALHSLNQFSNLNSVWGNLDIYGNNALTNLEGLNSINNIMGNLRIYWNPSLVSFEYLENLVYVGADISIANPSLTNMAGLENLTSVNGSLSIGFCGIFGCVGNPSLLTLTGMENITSIEGDLRIIDNNSLNNLTGLSGLTSVEGNVSMGYTGAAGIFGNASLPNCDGLQNLASIGGDLSIEGNESLTSLSGLDSLAYIGGHLTIGANEILTNISNLNGVESIGGILGISNNNELTSLSGLDNIDDSSISDLYIIENDELYDCDVWSICQYLNEPGGTVVIENNATECNSVGEVEDHCLTSIDEFIGDDTFIISPNPLGSTSLIKYTVQHKSPVTIKIFDLSGQEMVTLVDDRQQQGEQQIIFNTNDLKTGIYFCVLKTNNRIQTKKIIKL